MTSPAKTIQPIIGGQRPRSEVVLVGVFVVVPLLALVLAVPVAWAEGSAGSMSWSPPLYCLTGLGVTVGFHRHFTHGAFRAKRALRIVLAVAGSMAMQGAGHQLGRRPPQAPRLCGQGG